jgi:UDP:flavonoid glycosyltransferase YjiC (YdhE family)
VSLYPSFTHLYELLLICDSYSAGTPQVIVPIWEDHYNFAQLTEDLGLGIYATRGTAPDWTVDGIAGPILQVVGDNARSRSIRAEAKRIGHISKSKPGRYVAAEEIAKVVLNTTG